MLLATLVLATGCEDPKLTQITVVVRSDIHDLDRVELEVEGLGNGDAGATAEDLTDKPLPRELALVYRGGAMLGPVVVTARGFREGIAIVKQTSRTSFVENKHVILFMDLTLSCVAVLCEGARRTCRNGECASIDVDPDDLRSYSQGYSKAPAAPDMADAGPSKPVTGLDAGPDAAIPLVCGTGMGDCDGDGKSCETNLVKDIDNCGECGNSCVGTIPGADATCRNGRCVITKCSEGFADCDGESATACERDVVKDGPCAYQQTIEVDNRQGPALSDHQVRLFITPSKPPPPVGAGCGGLFVHGGNGYYVCQSPQTNSDASSVCNSVGMELIRIDDVAENEFIMKAVSSESWTAGSRLGTDAWHWMSGGAGQYSAGSDPTCPNGDLCTPGEAGGLYVNWAFEQPKVDGGACMTLQANGTWRNGDCGTSLSFVCEADIGKPSEDLWMHVSADGRDIRFLDADGSNLDYWIESIDPISMEAVIWIRLPEIPAYDSKTIFMQYGTPNEAVSSISATMLFGDDFPEDEPIDTDDWNTDNAGLFDLAMGQLQTSGSGTNSTGRLVSRDKFSGPIILEASYEAVDPLPTGGVMVLGARSTANDGIGLLYGSPENDWVRIDGTWVELGTSSAHGRFYRASLHHSGSAAFVTSRTDDGSSISFATIQPHVLDNDPLALGRRYDDLSDFNSQQMQVRWKWIFARRYASPEPQATLKDNEHGGP